MSTFRNYTQADIISIAQTERQYHPQANLIDYYKLFYQAFFGQGHFIGNEAQAKRHLDTELSRMTTSYQPLLQDISNGYGLYRVSLDAVKLGLMSEDELLLLYLNSKFIRTDWKQWSEIWSSIVNLLLDSYPVLDNEKERCQCSEIIKNKAIISHSECFRLTYSPHYRVMQLSESDLTKYPELRKSL